MRLPVPRPRRASAGRFEAGLLDRARSGDPAVLAALRADLAASTVQSLRALLGTGASSVADAGELASAAQVVALARASLGRREVREEAVRILARGEGASADAIAELLGLPVEQVLPLVGTPACRARLLLVCPDRLTDAERVAARAHRAACAACRRAVPEAGGLPA